MTTTPNRLQQSSVLADDDNPIFYYEARRTVGSRRTQALQRSFTPVIFGVTAIALSVVAAIAFTADFFAFEERVRMLVMSSMVVLLVLQLTAGLMAGILTISQAAPVISEELELQSWGLLRTTVLPLRRILLGKLAAVMSRLRVPLVSLLLLRLITLVSVVLAFSFTILRDSVYYVRPDSLSTLWDAALFLPLGLGALVFVVFFMTQPVFNFGVNALLGMFYSAHASSRSRALAGGLGARLALWLAMAGMHVGLFVLAGTLYNEWAFPFGPGAGVRQPPSDTAIAWALGVSLTGAMLLIMVWQSGLMALMFGWVHRRMNRIGVK